MRRRSDSPVESFQGVGLRSLLTQKDRELHKSLAIVWPDRDGSALRSNGLFAPIESVQRVAEIEIGLGIAWLQRHRLAVGRFRGGEVTGRKQDIAQIVEQRGFARRGGDGLA